MGRVLGELQEEWLQPDSVTPPLRQALLESLFWQVVRALPPESIHPDLLTAPDALRFRAALDDLFQRHVHEPLDVETMASSFHMNRRSLTRLCRQHTGVSPAKAFLRFKLDRARDLLLQTTMSIKEISAYLGFPNPYHFSAVFSRSMNRSPRAFRETGMSQA